MGIKMEKLICILCIKNIGLKFLVEKLRNLNDKCFFDICGYIGGFFNEDNVD